MADVFFIDFRDDRSADEKLFDDLERLADFSISDDISGKD